MSDCNYKWLQFFADGGASGGDGGSSGAGTGVTSADAGQSTGAETADAGRKLEDLGVPKDKAEKYRQRMEKRNGKRGKPTAPAQNASEQVEGKAGNDRSGGSFDSGSSASAQDDSGTAKAPVDVDAVLKIPEVQQRVQEMMAARGKSATEERSAAQEQTAKLAPALDLLSVRYGIEAKDGQYDLDKLVEAITGDDLFFEDKAIETGESVDKVKADWKKDRETAQRQQQERQQQMQEAFYKAQNRGSQLLQQVPELLKEFPNFAYDREMQNPEFVHLVNSRELGGMGWDLRRAYRAVHQDEIEKNLVNGAAKIAKQQAARAQQAGQARPRENGGSSAPVAIGNDYASMREKFAKMTSEERRAYMRAARPPR